MELLKRDIAEIKVFIKANHIEVELIISHATIPKRAKIISGPLGGLLAIGYPEDGIWLPCYPERSTYPDTGVLYQPTTRDYPPPRRCWIKALKTALDPKKYLKARSDSVEQAIAEHRASYLRDPIRTAAMLGLIEQYEKERQCKH